MEKSTQELSPVSYLDSSLLGFLRTYFMKHPTFPWNENSSETKILINNIFNFEESDFGFFPRITIRRGDYQITNPTTLTNSVWGYKISDYTQKREEAFHVSAPFTIIISAKHATQVLNLMEEIIAVLLGHRKRIVEDIGINIQPFISGTSERSQSVGKDIEFSTTEFTILLEYIYTIKTDYLPKYPVLDGIELTEEVETKIEKNDTIDFKKISYKKEV